MCAEKKQERPPLWWSVVNNRCPRCRKGKLFTHDNPYRFKTTMKMPEQCPVCSQKYELQTGFYFGTGYVSYGLSVLLLALIFLSWHLILGLSYRDNSIFLCLLTATLLLLSLQPFIQRLSRSVWIAFFVPYDDKQQWLIR